MHHFGAWKLAGKFCRGLLGEAQPAQRYRRLGYFVDVVSAILRVSIWRRFRAETLHPLQSFDISRFIGNWNIFLYWKMVFFFFLSKGHYPFSSFERGIIHEISNTLLIIYYLPRDRYFTIHFSIIPLTHCPLVTGTSYYLLNNTKSVIDSA